MWKMARTVRGGEEVQAREDPRRKAAQGVSGGGTLEQDSGVEWGHGVLSTPRRAPLGY